MKLDYTLTSPEERRDLVDKIIQEVGEENLNEKALEILTDYIIFCMEKEEKRNKKILTENRMTTVNKRESSLEGLVSKLENGEDGLYNLMANNKNVIFSPSVSITKKDLEEIPELYQLRQCIDQVAEKCKTAQGKDLYKLKKMLIELRQDQYIIKAAYRKPIYFLKLGRGSTKIDWTDSAWIGEDGDIAYKGQVSIFNPEHVSALLCNYSALKQNVEEDLNNDLRWLLKDLETIVDKALAVDYPMYYDILIYKIDGKSNAEIRQMLETKYNTSHSLEYISSLYRNKIPKIIADCAQTEWINWYYTYKAKGEWKTCTRCKRTKLAHNRYFSKNKTAKSGWYSICKCCRNTKDK